MRNPSKRITATGLALAFASLALASAATLFLAAAPAMAQMTYTCALSGLSEVPPNASPATGSASVVLNGAGTQLSISCQFQNLAGAYTASHIHGPAPVWASAGVRWGFDGVPAGWVFSNANHDGTLTNFITTDVTPTDVANLDAGQMYINIHSDIFPGGEIRGQLYRLPCDGPCGLRIADVSVVEGNSGGVSAAFGVSLGHAFSDTVRVHYATQDGTATVAGNDYLATSGTLTFSPGQTGQPITITVNGDVAPELDETFFVNLSSPENAPIVHGQGVGTIQNDDAAWTDCGVPVTLAAGDQLSPATIPDGSGGVIATWNDHRSGNYDIYAQRVKAAGVPQWTTNGVALCIQPNDQNLPNIVSDGAGGAIVTWWDFRNGGDYDVYAQRINATGTPQWTANGVALCAAAGNQAYTTIATDGAGGAIVTWYDFRDGVSDDIYAQRVNAAGVPQWTANGVVLCTAANSQYYPTIVSDGANGAIVTWEDLRTGTRDVYAQRINNSGVPQWSTNGVLLCNAAGQQFNPNIISDGAGGAIVTWWDFRNGSDYDVYAQRINATGTPQWTANGVALCAATANQAYPTIASDGADGAIVTWYDYRNGGTSSDDIYCQRINATGTPQWTANGVALCTAANSQYYPTIISDGAGGAIATWEDLRSGTRDVYAQQVNAAGAPQWTAQGVALCVGPDDQNRPVIVSDNAGGAIVTWSDARSGSGTDIYAGRVKSNGSITAVPPSMVQDIAPLQAWPNPFTNQVSIAFSLSAATPVRMEVFDVAGRRVWVSRTTVLSPGRHSLAWDGRGGAGGAQIEGIYFLRVRGSGIEASRRVVRMK